MYNNECKFRNFEKQMERMHMKESKWPNKLVYYLNCIKNFASSDFLTHPLSFFKKKFININNSYY
jgi:hypothetical protein